MQLSDFSLTGFIFLGLLLQAKIFSFLKFHYGFEDFMRAHIKLQFLLESTGPGPKKREELVLRSVNANRNVFYTLIMNSITHISCCTVSQNSCSSTRTTLSAGSSEKNNDQSLFDNDHQGVGKHASSFQVPLLYLSVVEGTGFIFLGLLFVGQKWGLSHYQAADAVDPCSQPEQSFHTDYTTKHYYVWLATGLR